MERFVLFRESKRVTLNEADMSVDKICMIFQVSRSSLYITDDTNAAVFPESTGHFCTLNPLRRGHYEVHGVPNQSQPTTSSALPTFGESPQASGLFPGRMFQRSIHVAEIVNDKLSTSRRVVIRFLEADATVERMRAKVKDALGCDGPFTLTDSQGYEIVDSEATRSSHFWKQNSRKIYAISEDEFMEFQNRRRAKESQRAKESFSVQDVIGKIDQLKQAAEGLQDISSTINQLSELAKTISTLVTSETFLRLIKDAFTCLVCKALMAEPMYSTCCQSLIGCQACVEQWLINASHCLKCRAVEFDSKVHKVQGLSAVLSLIKELQTQ